MAELKDGNLEQISDENTKKPLKKKNIVWALLFALIEAVILCISLVNIFVAYNEVSFCTPPIMAHNFYDVTTTLDHEVTSVFGEVYSAGTEFHVTDMKMSEETGELMVTVSVYVPEFSADEAENSDELYEAYRNYPEKVQEAKEKHEQELALFEQSKAKSKVTAIVVPFVIAAVSLIFFIFLNKHTTLKKQILFLVIYGTVSCVITCFFMTFFSRAHAPIIYLYPEEETTVNVRLSLNGELTTTYPLYDEDLGWTVTASPDGTLTDDKGREYDYLFWEGNLAIKPDLSHGYCVKGKDTAAFLEEALAQLGLNDSEANTFIMYWLPQMESNEYNVITFQTYAYEDVASLEITPDPDTVIRVNMLWFPTSSYVDMEPQDLPSLNPSEREGFTVVEWGGEKYERGALSLIFR